MATLTGYVEHIIYQNPDNGYTVMEFVQNGELITCVGTLGTVGEGEPLKLEGEFVTHPTYGEQFSVERYEMTEPEDLLAIERYLGSGAIKGIGRALAARIVKRFKHDTLRIMDEEPERLSEVKGISENGAREIAVQVAEKRELRQAMMYLQQYGISLGLAVKIYDFYGPELYTVIQTNPYRMADDIPGVGFHIADDIASKVGIASDSDYRIASGIYYTLTSAVSAGHVYLPKEVLMSNASALLDFPRGEMDKHLMDLVMDRRVVVKEKNGEDIVYAAMYYYMELNVALGLRNLDAPFTVKKDAVDRAFRELEEEGLEPDEDQRKVVETALSHGVSIITGGPGTGKTTIINAIIRIFTEQGLEIKLAAPTGRAAKRMTEATGHEARTIHRLLEFIGIPTDEAAPVHFEKNENNPIEADAIIIDEMSMVDIFLMNALVRAVPPGARLIMVGDANQLPSVGPGNVLRDLIDSEAFSVVRLNKIYRQTDAGDIVVNAHRINDGEIIDVNKRSRDFLFVKREDSGHIIGAVTTLVKSKLPEYVHAAPFDIQVLTPMRKGALGVENLNKVLQEALNPPSASKREKLFPQGTFREGDKVMQIRNNYQMEWSVRNAAGLPIDQGAGVFNGDMGVIREINLFAEEMIVEFDDSRRAYYPFRQADELELAYAVTVHKSQGSEYPAVVIPLLSGPRPLMNRNLIYTAVTRARSCVCIVGSTMAFQSMVDNDTEENRYSGLADRLREEMA